MVMTIKLAPCNKYTTINSVFYVCAEPYVPAGGLYSFGSANICKELNAYFLTSVFFKVFSRRQPSL